MFPSGVPYSFALTPSAIVLARITAVVMPTPSGQYFNYPIKYTNTLFITIIIKLIGRTDKEV